MALPVRFEDMDVAYIACAACYAIQVEIGYITCDTIIRSSEIELLINVDEDVDEAEASSEKQPLLLKYRTPHAGALCDILQALSTYIL